LSTGFSLKIERTAQTEFSQDKEMMPF